MSIFATALGNATRDAEVKAVGNTTVVKFSIASNRKVKGQDQTTFVNCSWFGGRAEKMAQYITKGGKYLVVGEVSQREYNGKQYLEMDVSNLEFAGGKRADASATPATGGNNGFGDDVYGEKPADDSAFPF